MLWGCQSFLKRNRTLELILVRADLKFVCLMDFKLFKGLLNGLILTGGQSHPDNTIGGDSPFILDANIGFIPGRKRAYKVVLSPISSSMTHNIRKAYKF